MSNYTWKPIEPLSDSDRGIDLAAIEPLYDSWKAVRERLNASSPDALKRFTERLSRLMSVETGILERIYELDRGTTEALVEQGFMEELVSHASTDIEPGRLIDILRDQDSATQLVIDCATGQRDLTIGTIHELHAILTAHQDTTSAMDQFGNRFEIQLVRGEFKHAPNNPKRTDGTSHEYCPPLQVQSQMEQLLVWCNEHRISEDPIILATWLHHRFTQIHPYQDGNGRVGRVLITLVLLCADLLPLVIDRDMRVEYIDALESADDGNLEPLASLLARLERAAILEALSIDVDVDIATERTLTSAVIDSLAAKFDRRRQAKHIELRKVNQLAEKLRGRARAIIEDFLNELARHIAGTEAPEIHIQEGGPDYGNSHWYRVEVVKSANNAGKFANFDEDHYFVKATMRVGRERLVFVTSFHHVGRELSGVMEATSFAQLETFENSEDRECVSQDFFLCALDPFVFTYRTSEEDIADAFFRWLDAALAVALKEFGDRL